MPNNFLEKFNPMKLISSGLLNSLPFILSSVSEHAPEMVTKIQEQIKAKTATKEQVKQDIRNIFLTAEDFTPDAVDACLETLNQIIDLAFVLEEQVEVAFPPKA
jgi:uncharacterized protein YbcC (UPF0753/DUF2309 family)